jgi:hypothetical protein
MFRARRTAVTRPQAALGGRPATGASAARLGTPLAVRPLRHTASGPARCARRQTLVREVRLGDVPDGMADVALASLGGGRDEAGG